jgi:hypothetical protein
MVSVASTRPGAHPLAHHGAHMPPRSQGYASSTAANTARYHPVITPSLGSSPFYRPCIRSPYPPSSPC